MPLPEGLEGGPAIPAAEQCTKQVYTWVFELSRICLATFWVWLGPIGPSPFPLLTFRMKMSVLCLSYYYILEAYNFSGFIGLHLEMNFASI